MQAVIGAAGGSTRFYPLSNGIHKSMVRLLGKPILEYTIEGLKKIGIKDLIIISGPTESVKSYFGNGKSFGVSIKYVIQPEPIGAGNGILLAKDFILGDFIFVNPTHIDIEYFAKKLIDSKSANDGGILLVRQKENTWDNGVVKVKNGKVEDLIEKPAKGKEPSKFCVIGIYLFPSDFLNELETTPFEHYQLEKAISSFAKKKVVKIVETKEETVTLKYPWDLLSMKNYLLKTIKRSISKKAKIAESAEILGEVVVEDNAEISNGAKIKGPCYIGKNSFIGDNVILRNGVDIEDNVVVGANMEIKNTIIMASSKVHSGFIGDSILGENSRVGAQFCTANVRLDRTSVKVVVKGKEVDSRLKSLGIMTGRNVKIGVKSSTMPGILIGENAIIGPSTTVLSNVDDNAKYYSKFQGVVVKK